MARHNKGLDTRLEPSRERKEQREVLVHIRRAKLGGKRGKKYRGQYYTLVSTHTSGNIVVIHNIRGHKINTLDFNYTFSIDIYFITRKSRELYY